MILTTTSSIEGKQPRTYHGIVAAEVIYGANFIKDWLAEGADFWGGRSHVYEKVFTDARDAALKFLSDSAAKKGANAVLNIRFNYTVLGEKNGMMMVAATGTAVSLSFSKEEIAAQEAIERAGVANFMLEIDGKRRGPFSAQQLLELVQGGKVGEGDRTELESGEPGPLVGEILATVRA